MSELNVGQLKGLPVNSNVMTVPSGHTLYAPGHVIQTVEGTTTTPTVITATTQQPLNLSATITPKFATSKILVIASVQFYVSRASNRVGHSTAIYRLIGGTGTYIDIENGGYESGLLVAGAELMGRAQRQALDSPNTTSPITYSITGRVEQAGMSVSYGFNNSINRITLMEIAA